MKKSVLALSATAVAAMIAAPVAAAERFSAPIAEESELGGDNGGLIVGAIALGVAIAGVLILIEAFDDDDDVAVSP